VAFIAGVSDTTNEARRKNLALLNGVLFVLGFTTVFILLGLSTTAAGGLLRDNGDWLARIGGTLVIVFGLHLLGILRIPFLNREFRALSYATGKPLGFATTYVVGGAFAAGWSPCIGPVLAAILTLSATQASLSQSAVLLGAYSAGLAIPFLLATAALDRFLTASTRARKWMPWVDRIAGVMLLALGALLITGAMTRMSAWFA
jgi:cytochrome c-type biogenesis protein